MGSAMLHISKVAFGCASIDTLGRRQQARIVDGAVAIHTRFRPTRAEELIGGSIFWIVKQRLAARQTILGFDVTAERRTIIRVSPELVPVKLTAKRGHQGWRYLTAENAPADFDGEDEDGLGSLPSRLALKLEALALI